MNDDGIRDVLDVGGRVQQERAFRLVMALLTGEQDLGAWLRTELESDPRGYATAMWALVFRLGENLADLLTVAHGENGAVEFVRTQLMLLALRDQGDLNGNEE